MRGRPGDSIQLGRDEEVERTHGGAREQVGRTQENEDRAEQLEREIEHERRSQRRRVHHRRRRGRGQQATEPGPMIPTPVLDLGTCGSLSFSRSEVVSGLARGSCTIFQSMLLGIISWHSLCIVLHSCYSLALAQRGKLEVSRIERVLNLKR
jgi:hypothetical protein